MPAATLQTSGSSHAMQRLHSLGAAQHPESSLAVAAHRNGLLTAGAEWSTVDASARPSSQPFSHRIRTRTSLSDVDTEKVCMAQRCGPETVGESETDEAQRPMIVHTLVCNI